MVLLNNSVILVKEYPSLLGQAKICDYSRHDVFAVLPMGFGLLWLGIYN